MKMCGRVWNYTEKYELPGPKPFATVTYCFPGLGNFTYQQCKIWGIFQELAPLVGNADSLVKFQTTVSPKFIFAEFQITSAMPDIVSLIFLYII